MAGRGNPPASHCESMEVHIMKKSDYNDIITKISNPDTMAEGIVDLTNKLEADEKDFERISKSINDLRDTNSKLALKITNVVQDTPSEEDLAKQEADALEQEFLNQFIKEE